MPSFAIETASEGKAKNQRRKKQKQKYLDKGISERKAEELLIRYAYKWIY